MPGNHSRNEVSYYPEIQTFIEAQLKSNFRAKCHKELSVFWGIGELKNQSAKESLLSILINAPVLKTLRIEFHRLILIFSL